MVAASKAAASDLIAAAAAPAAIDPDWAAADAIVAAIRPPLIPAARFTITDFGAKQDAPAHVAVQAAVDAAAAAGGGRVVVPEGVWRMNGALHLRSNVELHLESGAVLRFGKPGEIALPMVLTRWEGTEVYNFSPLIYARDCENVAITGNGMFDGQGKDGFYRWRGQQDADKAALRDMGTKGVPVEKRVFGPGHYLRPAFVQFFNCRNVMIDGPKFVDSPFWTIHPVYCDGVIVRNIAVVSKHLNSDGCDPDSCTNVLIEKCHFDVSDDCIAIKSGRDQDGWRVARPTKNVVIRDCRMRTDIAAAIAIGSEMSGGAANIFAERIQVKRAEHAIYFKANLERGGVVEQVRVRDVKVANTNTLINFTTSYHGGRRGKSPPTYKGFTVESVDCRNTGQALHIVGVPQAPVQDVLIRNVTVATATATAPAVIQHTRDLRLDQVRVNGQYL
ncbi:MAG: glycoside hydrolase family 28 protein [Sphingomonas sp.]|uniref:glycoside hydrolase family 28 protein n=1 Tax=Sphingomonas sp. TaxID=28214 RepID=UPI001AC901E9|nr:glycoside hydrolase family 28 protein [Sphingomonas sp.]MBN8806944.1 glycoside hydrolase family 28 protein [Sphingomonas sp.]